MNELPNNLREEEIVCDAERVEIYLRSSVIGDLIDGYRGHRNAGAVVQLLAEQRDLSSRLLASLQAEDNRREFSNEQERQQFFKILREREMAKANRQRL